MPMSQTAYRKWHKQFNPLTRKMERHLDNCPVCGSKGIILARLSDLGVIYYEAKCPDDAEVSCCYRRTFSSIEGVIKLWNGNGAD